jgi:hypothetical protein
MRWDRTDCRERGHARPNSCRMEEAERRAYSLAKQPKKNIDVRLARWGAETKKANVYCS